MEVNESKGKNISKGNSKGYYRKPHNGPEKAEKPVDADALKHINHVKTVKIKKFSEETVSDIIKDIERLEKEIDLEIKEIQSAKSSY
jgi:hypothetical protein